MTYEKRRYPYLEKRRRRWYAVMEIPKKHRERFGGKARFVKSLGTESISVVRREVYAVVDAWKDQLSEAWPTGPYGEPLPHPTLLYRAERAAKTDREREAIDLTREEAAWFRAGEIQGMGLECSRTRSRQAI